MASRPVLITLPDRDFDPTEVAVPWQRLRDAGHDVIFATEHGAIGQVDPLLLTGVIFGKLGALPENVALFHTLEQDPSFRKPMKWSDVRPSEFALLHLPGGHAKGMKQYLESRLLQAIALGFVQQAKPVSAICHGVIVLARTLDPKTGKSVLHGKRVTALTKVLEGAAFAATFWKLGRYYRTYPEYVQDEVARSLGNRKLFQRGPIFASYAKPFWVEDEGLITARWPGDATGFADAIVRHLASAAPMAAAS